ncbi:MAG: hypothetical protein GQ574_28695 [Crocinitomix sp.]|nr:hypothetical protein [Crocinitomix sp.]
MYRTVLIIGIISSLFSCACDFEKEDWLFNKQELNHFSSFEKGDTIVYSSDFGACDTIVILEITDHNTDSDINCGGLMPPKLENNKSVKIQHLPKDNWKTTTTNGNSGGSIIREDHQSLLSISKFPELAETSFQISFQNFNIITDNLTVYLHEQDTLINGLKYDSYYKFEPNHPERLEDSTDISIIIWTEKAGLTAYQNMGGHNFVKNKR